MINLEKDIKEMCDELGITLSVAESLTSGNIQSRMASVSGSSSFFEGGLTVYNIDQKVNLLDVDWDHANSVNCVSERVAEEMAKGCNNIFMSDISVSVTGYAEPSEEHGVEIPFCYYSINYKGDVLLTSKIESPSAVIKRNPNRSLFSNVVIHNLHRELEKLIKNN